MMQDFEDRNGRPLNRWAVGFVGTLIAVSSIGALYGWGAQVVAAIAPENDRFTCTVASIFLENET